MLRGRAIGARCGRYRDRTRSRKYPPDYSLNAYSQPIFTRVELGVSGLASIVRNPGCLDPNRVTGMVMQAMGEACDIHGEVAIGASAGGVEAVTNLPPDYRATCPCSTHRSALLLRGTASRAFTSGPPGYPQIHLTVGDEPMTSTDANLIDDIIADHRTVESVFAQIEGADPHSQPELVEHVIAELVRHSVAEEQYLYPTARQALEDGDSLADHELKEHAEAEEVMKEIEKAGVDDPRYDDLVRELIKDIRHHIKDEEGDLLPKLRQECSAKQLGELSEKFQHSKAVAPTRPHPSAPDKPPANKILAPGAGLIDRMRDALSGRKV
jgi:hemerythrin superfamily protein